MRFCDPETNHLCTFFHIAGHFHCLLTWILSTHPGRNANSRSVQWPIFCGQSHSWEKQINMVFTFDQTYPDFYGLIELSDFHLVDCCTTFGSYLQYHLLTRIPRHTSKFRSLFDDDLWKLHFELFQDFCHSNCISLPDIGWSWNDISLSLKHENILCTYVYLNCKLFSLCCIMHVSWIPAIIL